MISQTQASGVPALDVKLRVGTDPGSLGPVRRLFTLWLELREVARIHRIDAQLVLSELLTNAIEHGEGEEVAIDMSISAEDAVTLCVSNEASHPLPPVDDWTLPDARSRRGRGLAIIARASREVETTWRDGLLAVTVLVPVGPAA